MKRSPVVPERFCLLSVKACLALLVAPAVCQAFEPGDVVDFQRDVQPVFAEHCTRCHGADAESRESGLRLDLQEHALRGGDSGEPVIVPGHPQQSELIARIRSDDPDLVMPPISEKKPLSPKQIDVLTRWIRDGAAFSAHWAFLPPRQQPLPDSKATHAIDKIVLAKLNDLKIEPAPPADDSMLCRRLYLDLVGLPPSPEQLAAFRQQGFGATADLLLKSERFGEKWARHWLDVARYSDTNGYEKDLRREQWAWRDWVVDALNRDLPYDQFIVEQIAGDLLPDPTQQQVIATGFLRNSMLNEEGAIVPEQFRMVEMFDRMDCIGKAILGLTTQCAQCHTHKFDPLTQDEYFGMFAFLNNSYEAQSQVYTGEQLQQIGEIHQSISQLENQIREKHPKWSDEIEVWERDVMARQAVWTSVEMAELGSVSGLNHPVQLADQSILMLGHTSTDVFFVGSPNLQQVSGIRVEILTHGDLPYRGPGRSPTGSWTVQEVEVYAKQSGSDDWTRLKLHHPSADFSQPEKKSDDGKTASGPVRLAIDGSKSTTWNADRGTGRRNQPSVAVFQFQDSVDLPPGTQFKVALYTGQMVGCCRINLTQSADPQALPLDYAAVLAMRTPVGDRTKTQQASLFTAWRTSLADCQQLNGQIAGKWKQYPQPLTSVLHLAEREDPHQRATQLLDRGEWDRPQKVVPPHTPAALHPLKDTENPNRLAFARWLASERSPLTARVAVNRVWQAMFGEGLVETPEDFGSRAPVPEHPELLDWLAVDFMRNGWSQKHLIKRIVSSATYQRSSRATEDARQRDPRNRLLARGPRFRCEAEVVRDVALSVSGLIRHELGGPPVIPPVPQNVLDYNYVYPSYWKPATGSERYRRTLYGFRKRSMPDPVISNFDGPNGDISCARRPVSNTPIAALTALNETVFFESAQAMALRILREGGASDTERADYAFQLCTSRLPTEQERELIIQLLQSRRQRLADGWLNPREIATGDAKKLPALPANATPQDAAAWTIVSRVLLNLDETISKN